MDGGVGETLREARGRREIDLAEVEASTKIRARFLRAIENEEWDLLPGDAYARSFIRTYAAFLGLDGDALAERQRQSTGAQRPVDALPRAEPAPLRPAASARRGVPVGRLAGVAAVAAVLIALAVALASGGDGDSSGDPGAPARKASAPSGSAAGETTASERPVGLSLQLAATAEVWVCLLDGSGEELVDGQILSPGAVEGPYRSGSFTVSLGNGEVTMTVDGQQASIPQTSSPIGFSIGHGGAMRELSESERPTCT